MAVSIIIPLYNKERHIKNTLCRVLEQEYSDFEIIVINDGSTDQSAAIVRKIKDNRIILIEKQNEGVSKTRNLGVKLAKYELIAFLDADDEWEPDYLKRIVALSEKYPDAAIYASNYSIIEKNGKKYSLQYPGIKEEEGILKNYFYSAYSFTPLWTSAVCVRKSIFEAMGGFPTNIKNGEDLDLWCRIALKYQIAYINVPLAIYRRDSDNMLSRSIVDPSWFPFLIDYKADRSDLISDTESVEKYIEKRQLEAASAALFIVKDSKRCNSILSGIKKVRWNKKKFYGLCILSRFPQRFVNFLYWRILKNENFSGHSA